MVYGTIEAELWFTILSTGVASAEYGIESTQAPNKNQTSNTADNKYADKLYAIAGAHAVIAPARNTTLRHASVKLPKVTTGARPRYVACGGQQPTCSKPEV